MKKTIILFLVLALFLPAVSIASGTEAELVGTWVGSSEFYYGEVSYFLVRLYDDHTALYETNNIKLYESEGYNNVYNATWELKDDGLHVYYKNIFDQKKKEDFILYLTQAHYLAHPLVNSYVMFVKLPERKEAGTFHTVPNWD